MTNVNSFMSLKSWIKEVQTYAGPDVKVLVLANKSDLLKDESPSHVQKQDIADFETETGLQVAYVSAKSGDNVTETFTDVTKQIIDSGSQMT